MQPVIYMHAGRNVCIMHFLYRSIVSVSANTDESATPVDDMYLTFQLSRLLKSAIYINDNKHDVCVFRKSDFRRGGLVINNLRIYINTL